MQSVGFTSLRITEYFDPFGDTSKERVARKYGVRGVNVHALRAPGMRVVASPEAIVAIVLLVALALVGMLFLRRRLALGGA